MRHLYTLLIAMLTLAASANDSTRLSLTPFLGLGLNSPSVKTDGSVQSRHVLNAGVRLDYHLGNHWMLGAGLQYHFSDIIVNNNSFLRCGMIGLTAAATFRYRAIFLDTGLQLDVPVHSDFHNPNWEAYHGYVDNMGNTNGVVLGWPVGIGVQLRHVVLRAGATVGLTRVYNSTAITAARNNIFTFTIGYRFHLK